MSRILIRFLFCLIAICMVLPVFADEQADLDFYNNVISAPPLLPATHKLHSMPVIGDLPLVSSPDFLTVAEVGMEADWESRVASNWTFFNVPASLGKITVIDFGQTKDGLGFRYLANANTQNMLYEPWSSSKIMAFAAALASIGQNVTASAMVGDVPMADLITSINSYAPSGKADGNSNAIATYFANVAGREFLTGLFHEKWLKLNNPDIRFRGAYGPEAFKPSVDEWQLDAQHKIEVSTYAEASDDPFYQSYRCEVCGLTGNKPMTTLAQAEFLKRLVTHSAAPQTNLPGFRLSHLEMLLYGDGHSNSVQSAGGMQAGIGLILARAIAKALAPESAESAKVILDNATNGNWRIFQKVGAGPSETRGQSETVLLAHVTLPMAQGPSREFTLAVQTEVPGVSEAGVGRAGQKMQQVLDIAMRQLLRDTPSDF